MANDEQDRLRKLAELRDGGVLSDEEYRIARARLVAAARRREEGPDEPDEPSLLQSYWPAFLGLAVLIVLIVGVVVYGRMAADRDASVSNIAAVQDLGSNVLDAEPASAELCASTDAYARIRDMIFEQAQQQYGGNPGPLASLRQAVGVRMQYPLLRAVHDDVGRTDCSGHLVLDLPPPARGAFDGLPTLEADLEYGVQQAADGNGTVVEFTGADEIVRQLAVAAGLVASRGSAGPSVATAAPEPRAVESRPSFECSGALSNTERLICSDGELSRLDRDLAATYRSLRERLSPDEWEVVSEHQLEFLRRRANCPDLACLRSTYVAQIRFLGRFGEDRAF